MGITWSKEDITAARDAAMTRDHTQTYLPVEVEVTARDEKEKTVTLSVPTINGTTQELKGVPWGEFQIMWAMCPSTLGTQAQPTAISPLPSVGTKGRLYIHSNFIGSNNIKVATKDVDTDLVKWPREN